MPTVTASIRTTRQATPRSRLLTVELDGRAYPFLPGQAVIVTPHGRDERRPYSIACAPEHTAETGCLELLVGVDGPGGLPWAEAGNRLQVDGPLGTFTFPVAPEQSRLLFVAGGTGIAPLRAMIGHVRRQHPESAVSVLYSARTADEFAFIDELRAEAQAGRLELHQTVTRDDGEGWQGPRGRIGRAEFESALHAPADTLCFVCGPPAMVADTVATLRELGVPEPLIRTEQWGRK